MSDDELAGGRRPPLPRELNEDDGGLPAVAADSDDDSWPPEGVPRRYRCDCSRFALRCHRCGHCLHVTANDGCWGMVETGPEGDDPSLCQVCNDLLGASLGAAAQAPVGGSDSAIEHDAADSKELRQERLLQRSPGGRPCVMATPDGNAYGEDLDEVNGLLLSSSRGGVPASLRRLEEAVYRFDNAHLRELLKAWRGVAVKAKSEAKGAQRAPQGTRR